MRYTGIIIAFAAISLAGCKTSSVTSSGTAVYDEELGHLRPELDPLKKKEEDTVRASAPHEMVAYRGHIRAELDSVNRLIAAQNEEQRYVNGYTIQIYTGNSREEANEARLTAMTLDAALEPVISYHQPGYKVKVGSYSDRLEAHKVYQSLKDEFPLALLIPERIKIDYD